MIRIPTELIPSGVRRKDQYGSFIVYPTDQQKTEWKDFIWQILGPVGDIRQMGDITIIPAWDTHEDTIEVHISVAGSVFRTVTAKKSRKNYFINRNEFLEVVDIFLS